MPRAARSFSCAAAIHEAIEPDPESRDHGLHLTQQKYVAARRTRRERARGARHLPAPLFFLLRAFVGRTNSIEPARNPLKHMPQSAIGLCFALSIHVRSTRRPREKRGPRDKSPATHRKNRLRRTPSRDDSSLAPRPRRFGQRPADAFEGQDCRASRGEARTAHGRCRAPRESGESVQDEAGRTTRDGARRATTADV